MKTPTKYALATMGLLAASIAAGPIALADDMPSTPPAGNSTANDDHMMGGSMMKMMDRMSGMMDRCEKMMERPSNK